MATNTCRECTTAFAVGLPACPNCQSTDHEETGMPKITVHGGPSNSDKDVEEVQEWPGSPSSQSTDEPQKNSEESEALPLKPAHTTEPRSSKDSEDSSSAPSKSTTPGRKTAK